MKVKNFLTNPNKWMKGEFHNQCGRYCLVGAINKCYGNNYKKHGEIMSKVRSYLVNNNLSFSIVAFNDNKHTKFKDIKKLINKLDI